MFRKVSFLFIVYLAFFPSAGYSQNFFVKSSVEKNRTTVYFFLKKEGKWSGNEILTLPINEEVAGIRAGHINGIGFVKWKGFDASENITVTYVCNLFSCDKVHELRYDNLDIDVFSKNNGIYYRLGYMNNTVYKKINSLGRHSQIKPEEYLVEKMRVNDYSEEEYCSDLSYVLSSRLPGEQIFWQNPRSSMKFHDMTFSQRCDDD